MCYSLHWLTKKCGDRRFIDCADLNLTSFPKPEEEDDGSGSGSAAAEVLLVSGNRLTHIDLSVLSQFPRLRVFVARNCSIRSLTKATNSNEIAKFIITIGDRERSTVIYIIFVTSKVLTYSKIETSFYRPEMAIS